MPRSPARLNLSREHQLRRQLGIFGHFAQDARAPDHVVEDVTTADGVATRARPGDVGRTTASDRKRQETQ